MLQYCKNVISYKVKWLCTYIDPITLFYDAQPQSPQTTLLTLLHIYIAAHSRTTSPLSFKKTYKEENAPKLESQNGAQNV